MRALILAAGEGTRLRPLTLDRPKPMVPIGGWPLLEHLVELLRQHGVTQIAVNLHYKPEAIVEYFGDGKRFGVSIEYSWEPRLLGSAGAAKQLDWFLTEPFFVLYGDVLTNVDLGELSRRHAARNALATLVLYAPEDLSRCGVAQMTANGRITSFVEKPSRPAPGGLASAGICVFDPQALAQVARGEPSDIGRDVIPALVARGLPVYGHVGRGYILDVGSPARYAQAQEDYRVRRFVSPLDLALASRC